MTGAPENQGPIIPTPLEHALNQLESKDPEASSYIAARRSGFIVVARHVTFEGSRLAVSLQLTNGSAHREISSSSLAFLACALSHVQTGSGFFLPGESNSPSGAGEFCKFGPGEVTASFKAGIVRIDHSQIHYLELRESPPLVKRIFRLWTNAEVIRALTPALSVPQVEIELVVDGKRALPLFKGYLNEIKPFMYEGNEAIELTGADVLSGAKVLIKAKFNWRTDPAPSILGFSHWVEPEVLANRPLPPLELTPLDSFCESGIRPSQFQDFISVLERVARNHPQGPVGQLSRFFAEALSPDHPMLTAAAIAFKKVAELLVHQIPAYMVIGSVKGISTTGVVRIAPGLVIASPEHLPFQLLGRDEGEELCSEWDRNSARLITYFAADDAPSTKQKGWEALRSGFDLLHFSVSDASWSHLDGTGGTVSFDLDVHQQDAILRLDRWYHVHHLTSGLAHQYHTGIDKSSNQLALDDAAVRRMRQRLDLLVKRIRGMARQFPNLNSHLSKALEWLSRSRESSSSGERFICLWVALEYLVLRGREKSDAEAILGAMQSRLTPFMGRIDRVQKRFWKTLVEDSYKARCKLVHEATEDGRELERLIPYLNQAVVDVVWYSAARSEHLSADTVPAQILDELAQSRRPN